VGATAFSKIILDPATIKEGIELQPFKKLLPKTAIVKINYKLFIRYILKTF
jgi:hypothetical protein